MSTEEFRLDIFHDAPMPNDLGKVLSFGDCSELSFATPSGDPIEVIKYKIVKAAYGYRLLVVLDL